MNIPVPSFSELRSTFGELSTKEVSGIQGIEQWESGKSGPRVAITMSTHGNEPSGYAPYWFLRNVAQDIRPVRGSLTFIANNLRATEKYFSSETMEERRRCRFIDINMNRLPDDVLNREDDTRYEIRRCLELYPQYQQIDCALDIHSTAQESDPMIIQIKDSIDDLTNGLPIPVVLENIADIQVGIPACSLYGGIERVIPVLEIEAGSHENPLSFQLAIRSALIFLMNSGILGEREDIRSLFEKNLTRRYYRVVDSILLPDESYELTSDFPMFSPIRKEDVLATGNGKPLLSPLDGHAIFAPGKRKPVSIAEEALFLTEPVREKIISPNLL